MCPSGEPLSVRAVRLTDDSPVICEYLDSLHDGPKLIPAEGEARWKVLRLQALGDGICDAAVLFGGEMRRPERIRWSKFSPGGRTRFWILARLRSNRKPPFSMASGPVGTLKLAAVKLRSVWQ